MDIIQIIKTPVGSSIFRAYARIAHGLTFRVAIPADMDSLYRFRFEVYTDEGYVNPDDYPDKLFSDQFDPFSISVITLKNNRIIGCGRATRWSNLGLPVFQFFSIKLPTEIDHQSMVEMGRFMVDRAYRGKARLATLGMSLQLRTYLRSDHSIKWLIAFMSNKVRDAFSEIVPFKILDEYPPEQKHLQARTVRQGYWDKGVIHPVIAEPSQLL
ncbi:MAG: GNAT family N-acetyltransferase [Porticoccaceae bacterium]|nr:GNAT family N-acetyltransferase [Porticoccaceae bacterium]